MTWIGTKYGYVKLIMQDRSSTDFSPTNLIPTYGVWVSSGSLQVQEWTRIDEKDKIPTMYAVAVLHPLSLTKVYVNNTRKNNVKIFMKLPEHGHLFILPEIFNLILAYFPALILTNHIIKVRPCRAKLSDG